MAKYKSDELLIWVDAEFTGLDIAIDELVEFALIITTYDLQPIAPGIDVIIKPSDEALENMNDFVTKMHTKSGLLDELENGVGIVQAEKTILDYIKKFAKTPCKAILAGNSIWSDKRFIDKQMPNLSKFLNYRLIDVSSIKELTKKWYPEVYFNQPAKAGNHRALDDIKESIKELEYYREKVFI